MKQPQQQRKCNKHPPVLNILGHLYQPAAPSATALQRSRLTVTKIAQLCGCTGAAVSRVRDAFSEGGMEAVHALKWGAGVRYKEKLTTEEVAWLVHPETLRQQAHMSLAQKTSAFNAKFNRQVGLWDIRALYRGVGIGKQRFRRCLGPPNPTEKAMTKQRQYLDAAKEKLERLTEKGYDIFQCDASVFSPDSFTPSAWSLKG